MGFPWIAATATTTTTPSGTSHTLNLPSGIGADDLLDIVLNVTGVNNGVTISGFTEYENEQWSGGTLRKYRKTATGSEGATIVATSVSTGTIEARARRIEGWHGTSQPEGITGDSYGSSVNPASLDPTWGAEDTLYILDLISTPSATSYPSNMPNDRATADLGNGYYTCASADVSATSLDPNSMTLGGNGYYVYCLVGIRGGTYGIDTVTINPAPVEAAAEAPAPEVEGPATISPNPIGAVVELPEPSVEGPAAYEVVVHGTTEDVETTKRIPQSSGMTLPVLRDYPGSSPDWYDIDGDLGGALTVKEDDGSPSVADVTEIRVAGGSVSTPGAGVALITVAAGSIAVAEADGAPDVSGVSRIEVAASGTATVAVVDDGGGQVTITVGATGDTVPPSLKVLMYERFR